MRAYGLALALTLSLLLPAPAGADHETNPRKNLSALGFHDLGGDGFNTDVWTWVGRDGRLFATVGTWGLPSGFADPGEECPSETDNPNNPSHSGVKIVDATDPANPELVARLGTVPGAQNNDVKVERLPTDEGPMDLLVNSLEPCGAEGLLHQIPGSPAADFVSEVLGAFDQDVTGFQIWNVEDPENPVALGKYENGGVGTHNLYPYEKDGKAYVAAVYNEVDQLGVEEEDFIEGFLDIVDITDPSNPTRVSRWRLEHAIDQGGPPEHDVVDDQGNVTQRGLCQERGVDSAFCYNHDTWVSDDGRTAYLSFWDAGLILLDVSDPANPRFIGQAQEQVQANDPLGWLNEEGNTHVAVPMDVHGRRLVLVGDEDFTGGAELGVTTNSPPAVAAFNRAVVWAGTPAADGETADFIYVGSGCSPSDYALAGGPSAVEGKIVWVDHRDAAAPWPDCATPTYLFGQKVNLAAENGAIGFVQYPGEGGAPRTNATTGAAPIPALELFDTESTRAIRQAVLENSSVVSPGNTAPPVNATLGRNPAVVDPWGFLRIVDVTSTDPAQWREVSQFKAPHVEDPQHAPEDVFTAHNPLIGPDGRVYFAWYTDGVRVLEPGRPSNPGAFREVGWFVPRPEDHPDDNDTDPRGAQEDNFGFWGSQAIRHPATGQMLIFNTDLNRGLYILGSNLPDLGGGGGVRCPRNLKGNLVVGTNDRDILVGTRGRDVLCGGRKNDNLRGRAGNDLMIGGNGKDLLRGGPGNDTMRAGPGNDILAGGAGKDHLRGGGGRDTLRGGAKKDKCVGGGGKDRIRAC